MKSYNINTLDQCDKLIQLAKERTYTIFQMQFAWNEPDGFIMTLVNTNGKMAEIRTKDRGVQEKLISELSRMR
jgi:hypothetical protein